MAKSARASAVKKNRAKLKKNVFGPVEAARNERLSAKLLELASQPKPPRTEMEIEHDEAKDAAAADSEAKGDKATEDVDVDMDADETNATPKRSNSRKRVRSPRIEKKRHRKAKNMISFPSHPKKAKAGKKR